jgi:hypothetical protein
METIPTTTAYFFGKASQAVEILCVGGGDVKDRLIGAGQIFLTIDPLGVPKAVRKDVEWVREQLTRYPPKGDEGSLRATCKAIRISTGVKIAKRMNYVYHRLRDFVECQ